jgi:putative SOS response-associated peptidase YedK
MCGRFTLTTPADQLASHFEAPDPPPLTPRYDVAPSQVIAVVGLKPDGARRGIALLKWGLVANWAQSATGGPRPINGRAESVMFKFTTQLREQRCLIPATGFYEWATVGGQKRVRHFALKSGGPFAFAGLWDVWRGDGKPLLTGCLITTHANDLVRPIHDRMPVIVPPGSYGEWLDPGTTEARLVSLLKPYPADEMRVVEVGPAVNSPKNDGPECLDAA